MKTSARTRARRLAMQGLYEWQITHNTIASIEAQFLADKNMKRVDEDYFRELLTQVASKVEELDKAITPYLSRSLDEIDPIEKAVLRLGAYELTHRSEIPYRVIINEAVELAKIFGAEDGHKFVNGIMDKLASQLRAVEVNAVNK